MPRPERVTASSWFRSNNQWVESLNPATITSRTAKKKVKQPLASPSDSLQKFQTSEESSYQKRLVSCTGSPSHTSHTRLAIAWTRMPMAHGMPCMILYPEKLFSNHPLDFRMQHTARKSHGRYRRPPLWHWLFSQQKTLPNEASLKNLVPLPRPSEVFHRGKTAQPSKPAPASLSLLAADH